MNSEFDPFWDEHDKNRRSELQWLDATVGKIEDPFLSRIQLFKEHLFEKAAILSALLEADDEEEHYDLIDLVNNATELSDSLFGELIQYIMREIGNENDRLELLTGLYITTDNLHSPLYAEITDNDLPQVFVYNALKNVIRRDYLRYSPPAFLDSLEERYYKFTNGAIAELMSAYDYRDSS